MRLIERLAFPIAKRFIAGETLDDAISRAELANSNGIGAIINLLGEHTARRDEIEQACGEYQVTLRRLKEENIRGCISIKPSQIGLAVDFEFAKQNLKSILSVAKPANTFIWLDMEGSQYTQRTINLYEWLNAEYHESGLAIQANLRRTYEDLEGTVSKGGIVRLCKGAYTESPEIAWRSKSDIDRSFEELMRVLFDKAKRFAIATHDQKLIEKAMELGKGNPVNVEYQMLIGIRDDLKLKLVKEGLTMNEYIPYGKSWFSYSIRRLKERKRNILLLFRTLLS